MDKCFAAYCKYYATGEGVTTVLAVAGTPEQARQHFDRHAPEFLRGGMTVVSLCTVNADPVVAIISTMIPQPVQETLTKNPPGTTKYYSEFHFNLA